MSSENFLKRQPYRMVVKDNVKLVVDARTGDVLYLFDLTADPYELRNLAGLPAWAERQDDLRARLEALYADIVSRRNPNAVMDALP